MRESGRLLPGIGPADRLIFSFSDELSCIARKHFILRQYQCTVPTK